VTEQGFECNPFPIPKLGSYPLLSLTMGRLFQSLKRTSLFLIYFVVGTGV
jgi:hypothetical protein